MRTIYAVSGGLLVGALVCYAVLASGRAGPAAAPAAAPAQAATMPASADVGADVVALFYQALLQEGPPTIEQERAIFTPYSSVRSLLVLGLPAPEDEGDEPMLRTPAQKERRRLQEQQVDQAGPVVLEYFRKRKEWFLPTPLRRAPHIPISSLTKFVRFVDEYRPRRRDLDGFVVVVVSDRLPGKSEEQARTLLFKVEDGKVDPSVIWLNGWGGSTPFEKLLGELESARNMRK